MLITRLLCQDLLRQLCVIYGLCLPKVTTELVASRAPYTLAEFIDEAMRQEGLDPEFHSQLRKEMFEHCMRVLSELQ